MTAAVRSVFQILFPFCLIYSFFSASVRETQYIFKHFSSEQGLSNSKIDFIVKEILGIFAVQILLKYIRDGLDVAVTTIIPLKLIDREAVLNPRAKTGELQ
jgi:hypothetical protein